MPGITKERRTSCPAPLCSGRGHSLRLSDSEWEQIGVEVREEVYAKKALALLDMSSKDLVHEYTRYGSICLVRLEESLRLTAQFIRIAESRYGQDCWNQSKHKPVVHTALEYTVKCVSAFLTLHPHLTPQELHDLTPFVRRLQLMHLSRVETPCGHLIKQ